VIAAITFSRIAAAAQAVSQFCLRIYGFAVFYRKPVSLDSQSKKFDTSIQN
jgi:hypothetical protein